MKFRKILIANRGEIAVRIVRACRALGIRPVAVHCNGEENALHVRLAGEAYCLGPPLAGFLDPLLLVRIAKEAGCQAVHPGYGFISEQASFALACQKAGLCFIGPSLKTLQLAEQKTQARTAMQKAGIPVVPGSSGILENLATAQKAASRLGFPVILKAAYGGGGKGMKIARSKSELAELFPIVQEESVRSFGKGGIFLERYLEKARHIEVQILCDGQGNAVHLGERNCSIQRRHQKLLEEAPSPGLKPKVREKLFAYALEAAALFRYRNAGTVEFLVDGQDNIYFLEVNARIQVEHPVTEFLTGIDLVAEQIRIASGEPLHFSQKDIAFHGHAIECRIYAEDPFRHFFPSTGKLDAVSFPGGPEVRMETALEIGVVIDTSYDPLIGKIVVHGLDRPTAIARMQTALEEFWISPVRTTAPLFQRILQDRAFRDGKITTQYLAGLDLHSVSSDTLEKGLVLAALLEQKPGALSLQEHTQDIEPPPIVNKRRLLDPWTSET